MGGVAVGAHQGVGVGFAIDGVDHGAHPLQIDLVHDAVARGDHFDVLERALAPVDEVKAVLVAAVFDGAVSGEGLRVIAAAFHGQRVVDDQLHRHHRVHLRRVAAHVGDRVAQAGQVHQRGLAQDVMADHAHGKPREIQVATAFDQLAQVVVAACGIGTAHDVLGMHARGVRQRGPSAGLQGIDRGARVEVVERGARERGAEFGIHGVPSAVNEARAAQAGRVSLCYRRGTLSTGDDGLSSERNLRCVDGHHQPAPAVALTGWRTAHVLREARACPRRLPSPVRPHRLRHGP